MQSTLHHDLPVAGLPGVALTGPAACVNSHRPPQAPGGRFRKELPYAHEGLALSQAGHLLAETSSSGSSTCPPHCPRMSFCRRVLAALTRCYSGQPAGVGAVLLAAMFALGVLAWLGWSGTGTRNEVRLAERQAVRVAELRGTFAYLDEWLTMSASMAVLTGETRWVSRYEEASPNLTAAIAEAVALSTPEVGAALAQTTEEARNGLTQMERAALAMAGRGDRDGARLLLDGPEFAYLKTSYASGIEALGQDLMTLAATRTKALSDRAWVEAAGLVLGAVFLVAAAIATRGHLKLRVALACTATVARTDDLTSLPNRRHLHEVLQGMLARAGQDGGSVAVLLLDLDRFKTVNDVHGHPAGDQLLRLAASRLRTVARTGDCVARLGGDEFALAALISPPRQPCHAGELAAQLAQRIIATLQEPFTLSSGTVVRVGISIGVALSQQAAEGMDTLMHRADVALYRAKADGRGRCCFFEPVMDDDVQARALLESELCEAVANGRIVPHFQPLVSMANERLVGFEVLARWQHPTRGLVPPGEFIPVAEQVGLIGPMTGHLLRQACSIAAAWPDDTFVACNVSPLQLRDQSLPGMVRAALQESGLPPHRLELEITESALVGDLALARDVLIEVKSLGVRLALDDFGTGYSSLHHLKMLPFDKVKIDASFVGAMTRDPGSRKIVSAVVGLGQSLELTTVAEGVEDQETAAMLRELGCDVGQGWLFGRPGPADLATRLLRGCRPEWQSHCKLGGLVDSPA